MALRWLLDLGAGGLFLGGFVLFAGWIVYRVVRALISVVHRSMG